MFLLPVVEHGRLPRGPAPRVPVPKPSTCMQTARTCAPTLPPARPAGGARASGAPPADRGRAGGAPRVCALCPPRPVATPHGRCAGAGKQHGWVGGRVGRCITSNHLFVQYVGRRPAGKQPGGVRDCGAGVSWRRRHPLPPCCLLTPAPSPSVASSRPPARRHQLRCCRPPLRAGQQRAGARRSRLGHL